MKKAVLILTFSIFIIFTSVVKASPSTNPVYATIEQVKQMIANATFHQKELRLIDNNNQELGIFIQDYGQSPLIFIASLGKAVKTDYLVINQDDVFFQSTNCTGDPLTGQVPSNNPGDIIMLSNQFYLQDKSGLVITNTPRSRLDSNTGDCLSIEEGFVSGDMYKISPVTLPYNYPVELPVHISYQ